MIGLHFKKRLLKKEKSVPSTENEVLTEEKADVSNEIQIGKLHEQGKREGQQDCFAISPLEMAERSGILMVVADGMGGLADGDKVSQAAVTEVINQFIYLQGKRDLDADAEALLLVLLEKANQAVNQLLGAEHYSQSGSTLVMGLLKNKMFHYLSVGDSRICLYRAGNLLQLNREHIYRNELYMDAVNGEIGLNDARMHPRTTGLTSFLGMGRLRYVDLPPQALQVLPGDVLLLMSDGVYNAVTEDELKRVLELPPEEAAAELKNVIQEKNYVNQDNYTAVILKCCWQGEDGAMGKK